MFDDRQHVLNHTHSADEDRDNGSFQIRSCHPKIQTIRHKWACDMYFLSIDDLYQIDSKDAM